VIRFEVPYPTVSTNHMYVSAYRTDGAGNRYLGRRLSDKMVAWKNEVATLARVARHGGTLPSSPLHVEVDVFPPDRRRRDSDNLLKGLLDACRVALGIDDDMASIKKTSVTARDAIKGGKLIVTIRAFEDHN
jgi:crossover junction endodeoxyribonuclease RusA